jgi:hypothetical protein
MKSLTLISWNVSYPCLLKVCFGLAEEYVLSVQGNWYVLVANSRVPPPPCSPWDQLDIPHGIHYEKILSDFRGFVGVSRKRQHPSCSPLISGKPGSFPIAVLTSVWGAFYDHHPQRVSLQGISGSYQHPQSEVTSCPAGRFQLLSVEYFPCFCKLAMCNSIWIHFQRNLKGTGKYKTGLRPFLAIWA